MRLPLKLVTPRWVFPRATLPVTSVPIKLPCTTLFGASNATPSPMFPEIRLRAPGVVPPMVLLGPDDTAIPPVPLGNAAVPVASVPMKFPATTLSSPRGIPMAIALPGKRLMIRPRTPQTSAWIVRPLVFGGASAPLSSMSITALSPSPGGLVFGLDPGCV